jgi:hypothetical protein
VKTKFDCERAKTLLRAAYDILTKVHRSHYVISAISETTAFYDDAVCDGSCLRGEIADLLDLDAGTDPIAVPRDHRDYNEVNK